jgi:hypothetical protein
MFGDMFIINTLSFLFSFRVNMIAGHTSELGWEKARVATERNGTKALGRN